MAETRNSPIPTGAPWPVSIAAGIYLTFGAATVDVLYNTAQADMTSMPDAHDPLAAQDDLASEFRRHLAAWKAEMDASASSRMEPLLMSEHYLRIIGLGRSALPH